MLVLLFYFTPSKNLTIYWGLVCYPKIQQQLLVSYQTCTKYYNVLMKLFVCLYNRFSFQSLAVTSIKKLFHGFLNLNFLNMNYCCFVHSNIQKYGFAVLSQLMSKKQLF